METGMFGPLRLGFLKNWTGLRSRWKGLCPLVHQVHGKTSFFAICFPQPSIHLISHHHLSLAQDPLQPQFNTTKSSDPEMPTQSAQKTFLGTLLRDSDNWLGESGKDRHFGENGTESQGLVNNNNGEYLFISSLPSIFQYLIWSSPRELGWGGIVRPLPFCRRDHWGSEKWSN